MNKNGILLDIREKKGVSQEFLADLLDISRPTYASIESGKKELTISQAQKLCDFYQISFQELIKGKIVPLASIEKIDSVVEEDFVRIDVPQENVAIFREVLIYILNKIGGKSNVGQTVLYKLLYFIDFDFYELYERQLIGAKYMHNHYGPTPVGFDVIIEEMKSDGELEQVQSEYFRYPQIKYLPLREANLSIIGDALAIKHIDKEIERLSDKSANELTDLSHKDVPWISASHGEVLDYEAVFYRTPETSVRTYDGGDNI